MSWFRFLQRHQKTNCCHSFDNFDPVTSHTWNQTLLLLFRWFLSLHWRLPCIQAMSNPVKHRQTLALWLHECSKS
jgi:hypothetical protein